MEGKKNDKKETIIVWIVVIVGFLAVGAAYWFWGDVVMEYVAVLVIVGFVALIIYGVASGKGYLKKQKTDNTDKKKMLALMSEVMGDKYGDYTYVAGFFERTEPLGGRRYRTWYYSYVLAFNQTDMIILPFVVKDGQVLLRNRMPVDWNEFKLKYHIYKDDINLDFILGGETTTMYIRNVIKGNGVEKSSKPLAVYQESEVALLRSYLPGYPNVVKA